MIYSKDDAKLNSFVQLLKSRDFFKGILNQ